MLKTSLQVAAACLVAVVLGVALFEWSVDQRMELAQANDGPDRPFYAPDAPSFSFVGRPKHYTADGRIERRSVVYAIDQFGGRASAPYVAYDKPQTIALVGDSFTAGAENNFEDTLQGILARELPEANVLNFGRGGTSSFYYPLAVKSFLDRVQRPLDALVVGLFTDMHGGDIPRVLIAQQSRGYYVIDRAVVHGERYEELKRSMVRRAAFAVERFMRRWSSTYNTLVPLRTPPPTYTTSLGNDLQHRPLRPMLDTLLANLDATSAAASLSPDRVVVWFVASGRDAHARQTPNPGDYLAASDRFWREAADMMRSRGYVVVDPRPAVERKLVVDKVPVFSPSYHFQPAGYAVSAEAVVPAVKDVLAKRSPRREKLTERHKRFVDMAKDVEASEDPKDFEKAFEKVATHKLAEKRR